MAHLVFAHTRSLFNWAIARSVYGLETSPCDRLHPAKLIGPKEPRQRVLTDPELTALWRATEKLGYPFGPLYRLLLLTGARKNEVAGLSGARSSSTRNSGACHRSASNLKLHT